MFCFVFSFAGFSESESGFQSSVSPKDSELHTAQKILSVEVQDTLS